jgi:hypothetical protein
VYHLPGVHSWWWVTGGSSWGQGLWFPLLLYSNSFPKTGQPFHLNGKKGESTVTCIPGRHNSCLKDC